MDDGQSCIHSFFLSFRHVGFGSFHLSTLFDECRNGRIAGSRLGGQRVLRRNRNVGDAKHRIRARGINAQVLITIG